MSFSGSIYLTVLGNGANENPICLSLTTDKSSHLFNLGEATQRLIFEHKAKIGKAKNIYLTSCRHESFSGLFGYILTVAPCINHLTIHGPNKINEIFPVYEPFLIHTKSLEREFVFVGHEDKFIDHFDDEDISIHSLPLFDSKQPDKLSLIYLVQEKDKPGALSIDKCKTLDIPPGPLFGKLKNGQAIEIKGKTIQPSDVLGPPTPGSLFLIVDCPTLEHLACLLSNEILKELLKKKFAEFIVHITPECVWNNVKYQNWLSIDALKGTKHILLNKSNRNEICLLSSTIAQIKLNMIDSNIFKLLEESTVKDYRLPVSCDSPLVIRDCPVLFRYYLRKRVEMSFDPTLCNIDIADVQKEVRENKLDFYKHCKYYKENAKIEKVLESVSSPNCLLLGTGSSSPGVLRNTTAILLNLDEGQSLLLDCGEATLLQMTRYFGRNEINKSLRSIKAVFISHIHADHNFGLISLMKRRAEVLENSDKYPLMIVGPRLFGEFLSQYKKILPLPEFEFITCNSILFGNASSEDFDEKSKLLKCLSMDDINSVFVPHCYDSFGLIFTWKGDKYVYSGDSAYSNAFDVAGKGCKLLIHEATMNDDLREEADLKRHSTISDAINVGLQIEAQHTLLTHFSQRYAKVVQIQEMQFEKKEYCNSRVTMAYDFMKIPLNDFDDTPKMKGAFETLFSEDIVKQNLNECKKATKRKLDETSVIHY